MLGDFAHPSLARTSSVSLLTTDRPGIAALLCVQKKGRLPDSIDSINYYHGRLPWRGGVGSEREMVSSSSPSSV